MPGLFKRDSFELFTLIKRLFVSDNSQPIPLRAQPIPIESTQRQTRDCRKYYAMRQYRQGRD